MARQYITPGAEDIHKMAEMTERGATASDIAETLGISRALFFQLAHGDRCPDFAEAYGNAKKAYILTQMDNLIAAASAPLHENEKLASAAQMRQRLIVDTVKYVGSKLLPRIYGEQMTVEHNHRGEVTLSPLAQLRQLEGGNVVDITPPAPTEATRLPGDVSADDCF